MARLFDLHGKKKNGNSQKILVDGEWLDMEYIQYCVKQDCTLKTLEANLHVTDDPEEIAMATCFRAVAGQRR